MVRRCHGLRAPPESSTVLMLKSVDLGDTVDICFTVIAVFVNGHRYG